MTRPDQRVVIIVGAPRSGTSLLYKLLCTHPDANYLSNWNRRFPRLSVLASLRHVANRRTDRRDAVWFPGSNAYVAGRRAFRDRLFPMPVEADAFYAACGVYDSRRSGTPGRRSVEQRLSARLQAVMRAGSGTHLFLKCIANNAHLATLLGAYPDATVVDITRDGRAVAASLARVDWWPDLELWWWHGTPRDWQAAGRDPMEACARHWLAEVQRLREVLGQLARHDANRVLSLRYEDLVASPTTVLDAVATYTGLRPDPAWLARAARVPAAIGRPARPPDSAIVEQVQAEMLRELGYPPRELSSEFSS